ncbi:MAG: UPF0236 family protein [Eggerthellaceae bacterium]|nr:UPF0236 family protein [Eggerthellaceae bacterium]
MTDSIIMERVSDAAADCLYSELVKTEDFQAFEALVAADMRTVAAGALRRCVERFDAELVASAPRGWSVHERVNRTVVTLVGAVTFERTVFLDEFGRRRTLADELLGLRPRARLSPCCFLWIARRAAEVSYRKTAADFEALTSARISHVTVMNVVHREGSLLRETGAEFARDGSAHELGHAVPRVRRALGPPAGGRAQEGGAAAFPLRAGARRRRRHPREGRAHRALRSRKGAPGEGRVRGAD